MPLIHSVCAQSPVSAGAPVGQRTISGGNTCADTPNLSFYGHNGGLGCSARKTSKIFGTFCTLFAQKTPQFGRHLALVWPTRDQQTSEWPSIGPYEVSAANGGLSEAPRG